MLVIWTGILSSCNYDDDELWGSVDDLANRISAIEALTQRMNSDISAMQTIVTALENSEAITEVEKLTDGYILHFTNGETVTIKNGTDGMSGKDAPVIGLDKLDGIYYWTITVDGKTEWLTDEDGNKLVVANGDNFSGANGVSGAVGKTPKLKVDSRGYWMISIDGTSYEYIKGADGENINALGTDGYALFKDVKKEDETIVVVMNDGLDTEFVFPVLKGIAFYATEELRDKAANGEIVEEADIKNIQWNGNSQPVTFYYTINLENPSYELVDDAGMDVTIDTDKKSVTVALKGNEVGKGRVVLLFFNETRTLTSVFKFVVAAWDGTTSTAVSAITENNETVYPIATPANLKWIAEQVNSGTNTFENAIVKLLNDIDLAGYSWTPIGELESCPFSGTFDGNGRTIKGLNIGNVNSSQGRSFSRNTTSSGKKGAGLFGVVKGATIKSVTVIDAVVKAENVDGAGIIVGCALESVTIEEVVIETETPKDPSEGTYGVDVEGSHNVGSIAGLISASEVVINNCEVQCTSLSANVPENTSAEGTVSVGGIVGTLEVVQGYDSSVAPKVEISGCKVEDLDLSASLDDVNTEASTSMGGIVGTLKIDENIPTEDLTEIVTVKDNDVLDTQVTDTPSTENDDFSNTQGPVIGNLVDLDPSVSADIIKDNKVGEDVEIETQLSVQNLTDVLNAALKDGGVSTFDVKGNITTNTTVTIPAEGVDVTLNFETLVTDSDKVLTIKQGEGSVANNSTHLLTLNIPEGNGAQFMNIIAPETTVVLASGEFAEVTALVAKNTLVVEKDVTLEELSVVDGNIRVFGHVISLIRSAGYTTDVELIIEEGGRVDNIGSGFVVSDHNEGGDTSLPSWDKEELGNN